MTISMKMRSGFMAFALRTPSSPFSAAAVLKPCFSRAFCITNTSVGESSTIRINAILGLPIIFRHVLRWHRAPDSSAGAVEEAILAGQHDDRDLPEDLVVLDQRTGLVAVETRHHDV